MINAGSRVEGLKPTKTAIVSLRYISRHSFDKHAIDRDNSLRLKLHQKCTFVSLATSSFSVFETGFIAGWHMPSYELFVKVKNICIFHHYSVIGTGEWFARIESPIQMWGQDWNPKAPGVITFRAKWATYNQAIPDKIKTKTNMTESYVNNFVLWKITNNQKEMV